MKQGELERKLFLGCWISPTGLLGKNSVFEQPSPLEGSNVFRRAYYPLSSILSGGDVPHRILVTYELGRTAPQDGAQSIEIQVRSKELNGWVTKTIHTPLQFRFKLLSDLSFGHDSLNGRFMRFASENGFTICVPEETTLGQITLRSSEQKYRGTSLCVYTDQHGGAIVDVKAGPNVIIGAPPLKPVDFEISPDVSRACLTDRLMRASTHSAENSSFKRRLASWFSLR